MGFLLKSRKKIILSKHKNSYKNVHTSEDTQRLRFLCLVCPPTQECAVVQFPLTSYSIKKATFDIIEAKNQYIL